MANLDSSGNYLWVTRAGGSSDDIGQRASQLYPHATIIVLGVPAGSSLTR